ncbi:SRPBCC domain-containing protein [Streptomyces sp. NPDC089919]|uniref:SRPBCC domain-containing protein n=1 Tax=Streptomyces sp. NPDC089919 TaxID=3155188 RepID=UPI00344A5357
MEHQVFVPVTVDPLRAVLRDPARVARCVPGLQRDAEATAGPLAGRLKVRVAGHTVTYRGALAVTEAAGGSGDSFLVSGRGAEVRGPGTVVLTLRLGLRADGEGTWMDFSGGADVAGRAADFPPEAALSAVHRLLDRAGAALGVEASRTPAGGGLAAAVPAGAGLGDDGPQDDGADEDDLADDGLRDDVFSAPGPAGDGPEDSDAPSDEDDAPAGAAAGRSAVFDAEVPPPALDPALDPFREDDFGTRVPAEAAHARRTMIGRSAEEVDHAPPRGRYAPVPAPEAGGAAGTLRWAAPAAALAVASAVVVVRALRRRN